MAVNGTAAPLASVTVPPKALDVPLCPKSGELKTRREAKNNGISDKIEERSFMI
jgi:hypothetical protein